MKSSFNTLQCILACLAFCFYSPSLLAQPFLPFLETLEASTDNDKKIETYLASKKQVPILEGDSVIFIAHAKHNAPPRLLADFNGFLNKRYVADQSIGQMRPIRGSQWYYFIQEIPADGIINYSYGYGDTALNDPLNPNQRLIFGGLTSFVAMPQYKMAEEWIIDHSIPRGEVEKLAFPSTILGQDRTLHIYLPPAYDDIKHPLPTLYLHDGTFYVKEGRIPQILDYLIAHQMIQPVIAVFDDPVIRGKEYRGDIDYRQYIGTELIPYIDGRFETSRKKEDRAVIGGSRGGLSALHLAHALPLFGNCGVFSPAILPMPIPEFVQLLADYPQAPEKVYITGSTFDHIWYDDAVALKKHFNTKEEIDFHYQEIHDGHNIPAWSRLLTGMLQHFFPYTSP
ncbi:MAG: hypothetical protein KTR30_36225 [Saprospiraceae bacterium]|nr:hypothetical protein [Saprospiraceae bacterium]